jgi:hypothetical protein
MKIRLIVATRESQTNFFQKTATGRSLCAYTPDCVELVVCYQNQLGLPVLYNLAIEEAKTNPATLVFIHDDVHLIDFFWPFRLMKALREFDAVGLAGNIQRKAGQPSWAFVDTLGTWADKSNLSGIVGHGTTYPPARVSDYGPSQQRVKLLDGVFLAANSTTLVYNRIRFDEQFKFNFYDLDFCRQLEEKNLSCGTADIAVIHESSGDYSSKMWKCEYELYIKKWGS